MKNPTQTLYYFLSDLDAYKMMINLSERHWLSDIEHYNEHLMSCDESKIFGNRRDLMANLSNEYPQIQRRAFFIVLMTKLEDFLNHISLSLQNENDIQLSYKDLKGNGIERVKHYITKCTDIKFPSDSESWNAICNYKLIRNVIVHSDGHIHPTEQKKAHTAILNMKNINIEAYARNHIILEKNFIHDVIKSLDLFTNELLTELNNNQQDVILSK